MKKILLLTLTFFVLILVACSSGGAAESGGDAECPTPGDGEQLIRSETLGFCFLAPADYSFEETTDNNANLFFGSMMDVEHPKLLIIVRDAAGKTTAEAADEVVASFEGFEIPRMPGIALGSATAEMLDGVPGQDLSRALVAVHNDRQYVLSFIPSDPSQGEVYTLMEALFTQVTDSFRFLP